MKWTDTYRIIPDPHQSSPAEEAKRLGITVEQLYAQARKQPRAGIAELLALSPGKELTLREIEKTRKAMEKATEARAKEMRKAQRTSELPFPLPDIYDEDDSLLPRDALYAVRAYRFLLLRFGPDRDQDKDQLKKATGVALDIRLVWSDEWNLELAEVPLAKDSKRPTDEDFARLEQWLLTATNAIKKEIARCETHAAGRASDAIQGETLVPDEVVTSLLALIERYKGELDTETLGHHLRECIDLFGQEKWDSSIGHARNFVEQLLGDVADAVAKRKGDTPNFDKPVLVRKYMHDAGFFSKAEHEKLANGVYGYFSEEGSHPGISTQSAATVCLQILLAFGRFVVEKFETWKKQNA